MLKKALLSFAIVAFSGSVLAAPTANIYVKGKIGAPTCTVNGQDTADIVYIFDIDKNKLAEESYDGFYGSEYQTKGMEIICDAQTSLSFNVIDARADSNPMNQEDAFGLGKHNQINIGYSWMKAYSRGIKQTLESEIDNNYHIIGDDFGGVFATGRTYRWQDPNGQIALGQAFYADIALAAFINAELKDVAEEVELDGLAILSFSFGI